MDLIKLFGKKKIFTAWTIFTSWQLTFQIQCSAPSRSRDVQWSEAPLVQVPLIRFCGVGMHVWTKKASLHAPLFDHYDLFSKSPSVPVWHWLRRNDSRFLLKLCDVSCTDHAVLVSTNVSSGDHRHCHESFSWVVSLVVSVMRNTRWLKYERAVWSSMRRKS